MDLGVKGVNDLLDVVLRIETLDCLELDLVLLCFHSVDLVEVVEVHDSGRLNDQAQAFKVLLLLLVEYSTQVVLMK